MRSSFSRRDPAVKQASFFRMFVEAQCKSNSEIHLRSNNADTRIMTTRAAQVIQIVDGTISSPKVKQISEDRAIFCCAALTHANGDMYSPTQQQTPRSTAKVYTSLFVRHWDTWNSETENSLWFGVLVRKEGKWSLEDSRLTNLLAETRLRSPVPPFGGTGDFDISSTGIVFVAKDPEMNPARYTKTDLYYIPFQPSFATSKPSTPQLVKTGKLRGYSSSPVFSPDGKSVAFARMKADQYESDKQRLMLIPDVTDLSNVQEFYETENGRGAWDSRPDWITWSNDGEELYVAAEKHGRMMLWKLPSSPLAANRLPEAIYEDGSVAEARTLGKGKSLLVSTKSRVENSCYSILDPDTMNITQISSSSRHGKSLGLSKSQCADLWFPGSAGHDIHALVVKPSNFDESKRYPLAMLIHGGPQSAWADDWSTRWNPAIFAEQGYYVVCPNPTGSTGYGQDFTDAITDNWGGNPYEDLVKCFEYLENEVDYVDTDRAVALGGSYGGYMISK
jgi:dipeptidyl aminopeptidase/acylaminoacyl peptidase